MPFVRRAQIRSSRRLAVAVSLALAALVSACGAASAHPSPSPRSAAPSPAALPTCRYDDVSAARTGYGDWQTTLVDTIYRLPSGYTPPDLVPVSRAALQGRGSVRSLVVADLTAMAAAARSAGATLTSVSAYRSEDSQVAVFKEWESVAGYDAALTTAARPGHSEHQLGTAIDFGSPGNVEPWVGDWGGSPQGRWLATNAWRYGFILSYPPASSPSKTCYTAEPWHYRYFGRETAQRIHESGLSSREYLWNEEQTASPGQGSAAGGVAGAAGTPEFARARASAGMANAAEPAAGAVTVAEASPATVGGSAAAARTGSAAPVTEQPLPASAASLAPAVAIAALLTLLLAALSVVRARRPANAIGSGASTGAARASIRETRRPRA